MTDENEQKPKYLINIGQYGGVTVEAPNKEDAIELFEKACKVKTKTNLDEAIR